MSTAVHVYDLQSSHSVVVETNFDALYDEMKPLMAGQHLSATSLMSVVMRTMRLVESFTQGTSDKGIAKKALVLRLVERLIGDSALDQGTKDTLLGLLSSVGPSAIEAIIEADHEQFFKDASSWFKRTCTCCFGTKK